LGASEGKGTLLVRAGFPINEDGVDRGCCRISEKVSFSILPEACNSLDAKPRIGAKFMSLFTSTAASGEYGLSSSKLERPGGDNVELASLLPLVSYEAEAVKYEPK